LQISLRKEIEKITDFFLLEKFKSKTERERERSRGGQEPAEGQFEGTKIKAYQIQGYDENL